MRINYNDRKVSLFTRLGAQKSGIKPVNWEVVAQFSPTKPPHRFQPASLLSNYRNRSRDQITTSILCPHTSIFLAE